MPHFPPDLARIIPPGTDLGLRRFVVVTFDFEATHCWPECPIPEVAFLQNPHRHVFKVTLKKAVQHNDRDVEIIMLKRQALRIVAKRGMDLGRTSCEDLAEWLLGALGCCEVQVLEDGENGSVVALGHG